MRFPRTKTPRLASTRNHQSKIVFLLALAEFSYSLFDTAQNGRSFMLSVCA